MTQYNMVELSFKGDAPEASHVRIPMSAVIRNQEIDRDRVFPL